MNSTYSPCVGSDYEKISSGRSPPAKVDCSPGKVYLPRTDTREGVRTCNGETICVKPPLNLLYPTDDSGFTRQARALTGCGLYGDCSGTPEIPHLHPEAIAERLTLEKYQRELFRELSECGAKRCQC